MFLCKNMNLSALYSAMSGDRPARCFDRIKPAVEKILSEGTLLAGIHNIFLASLFKKVNFDPLSFHQISGS